MINLGLQMVQVLCCVIIQVIGATTRTRVAGLVDNVHDLKPDQTGSSITNVPTAQFTLMALVFAQFSF